MPGLHFRTVRTVPVTHRKSGCDAGTTYWTDCQPKTDARNLTYLTCRSRGFGRPRSLAPLWGIKQGLQDGKLFPVHNDASDSPARQSNAMPGACGVAVQSYAPGCGLWAFGTGSRDSREHIKCQGGGSTSTPIPGHRPQARYHPRSAHQALHLLADFHWQCPYSQGALVGNSARRPSQDP